MKKHVVGAWVFLAVLNGLLPIVSAAIELPPVLSSRMVLQRDRPVPTWGTGDANELIIVEFAGQKKETKADASGKWKVLLDPMPASADPRTMLISGASGKKEILDVLVGEVWMGAGQSNMGVGFGRSNENPDADSKDPVLWELIKAGPYPQIRIISSGGVWLECSEENVKKYPGKNIQRISKLLFTFGLRLHKELKVPIGLLRGSMGGTPSGAWMNQDAMDNDPACQEVIAKYAKIEGNKVIVTFDHVGQGLAFKNGKAGKPGKLQGFAIAGADGKPAWADAAIDRDTVVLSSDQVKQPVAISYACPFMEAWANFFNKDGLPALSFSTAK